VGDQSPAHHFPLPARRILFAADNGYGLGGGNIVSGRKGSFFQKRKMLSYRF
jgi:hypothetical protein